MFVRAQVAFHSTSGLPRDDCVNTFLFGTAGTNDDDEQATIVGRLIDFYNHANNGAGTALTNFMAHTISRANDGCTIKLYNMADPEPRPPIRSSVFSPNSASTDGDLPRDVALCLSFQGARGAGVPQARRRGRIYFGPLNKGALGDDGRPSGVADSLRSAGMALFLANDAVAAWVVEDGVDLDSPPTLPVHDGWVDNEFDTQRRRGLAPTARLTFS